jgi:head-tail adaptor
MEFHTSTEGEASARQYAEMGLYFTIRWRADLDPAHRLIFESKTYRIIGRPREIERRRFLKIQAELVE